MLAFNKQLKLGLNNKGCLELWHLWVLKITSYFQIGLISHVKYGRAFRNQSKLLAKRQKSAEAIGNLTMAKSSLIET